MKNRFGPVVLAALALALSVWWVSPAYSAPQAVSPAVSPNSPTSGELIENPKQWDAKTITFTGEAITQAMVRGDHAWIHVNDDAYYLKNVEEGTELGGYNSGHAVWLPTELAEKITYFGDYTDEGDVVRVRGTFNAACGQHGGDMDIHATTLDVVAQGHHFHEPVSPLKSVLAVVLALVAAALWFANRRAQCFDMFGAWGGRQGR